MNPAERITEARQAFAPRRKNEIDPVQYLLDKAARLASEAAAMAPAEEAEPDPVETEAQRHRRLIAVLTDVRRTRA